MQNKTTIQHLFSIPVIVAALGYFVDIYDLLLFGIVRVPSLKDLGLSGGALMYAKSFARDNSIVG